MTVKTIDMPITGRVHYRNDEELKKALSVEDEARLFETAHESDFEDRVNAFDYDLMGEDDAEILSDALVHLRGQDEIPLPKDEVWESRWDRWTTMMREVAPTFTTCRRALKFAQVDVPFDHRERYKGNFSYYSNLQDMLGSEFPFYSHILESACENPDSAPDTLVRLDDRLVSNVLFWHLRPMLFLMTHIPRFSRVFEIGGGYGGLARQFLRQKHIPLEQYVIADLPESLFFSEVALRKEFGPEVVGYSVDGTDPGTKLVLLPVTQLQNWHGRSDVVVNVGSMQEMSQTWVGYYMGWLDKYRSSYFYSLNYVGSPLSQMGESRNFWSPCPSVQWMARILDADVPLIRMMSACRHFSEALYERRPSGRTLDDWSFFRDYAMTRRVYVEGLDLLRHCYNAEYCEKFLQGYFNSEKMTPVMGTPKELVFIIDFAIKQGKKHLQPLADGLLELMKVGKIRI